MKIKINQLLILAIAMLIAMACNNEVNYSNQKFTIKRGLNISNWLCYADDKNNEEKSLFIQPADLELISKLGFDHVRIPVSEKYLWDDCGNLISDGFRLLHSGIRWAIANELRVVVDMHEVRDYHFRNENKENWHKPEEQKKFWDCWVKLSEELNKYPNSMLAYELTSTTTADTPESYNDFINKGLESIRELEPLRTIIIGAYHHNSPDNLHHLHLPSNDTNIILACHMWDPLLVNVYRAPWFKPYNNYTGNVNYPGYSIDTTQYAIFPDELLQFVKKHNEVYTKEVFKKKLTRAKVAADHLGLPLYVSEFGSYGTTDIELRQRLYSDIVDACTELDLALAHWDYKGSFNIVDPLTLNPNTKLVSILVE